MTREHLLENGYKKYKSFYAESELYQKRVLGNNNETKYFINIEVFDYDIVTLFDVSVQFRWKDKAVTVNLTQWFNTSRNLPQEQQQEHDIKEAEEFFASLFEKMGF